MSIFVVGKDSKILVTSQMENFLGQSRPNYVKVSVFQPTGNIRTTPLEIVIEELVLYSGQMWTKPSKIMALS